MGDHHQFPPDVLLELRTQPENLKCFDCQSAEHDWASVSNGVFICLACAGRHRALGVNTSFVRSLHMDNWTDTQVEMMHQGGNRQFRLFLESLGILHPSIEILYHSKAASLYRMKLRKQVDSTLAGSPVGVTIAQSLELNNRIPMESRHDLAPHSKPAVSRYSVLFPTGPMGMTVTKDLSDGRAYISRVGEGSAAQQRGVQIGDFVDGVAGKYISDFDIVMHMIPLMPRPVQLIFSRVTMVGPEAREDDSDDVLSSPEASHMKTGDHGHSLVHTTSSPALAASATEAEHPIGITSPKRRRRKREKMSITVLRSESMAACEHDSDSDNDDGALFPPLTPQSNFGAMYGLKSVSVSLESGLTSAKSSPMKSPRARHNSQSSPGDEVKSDSESVYHPPGSSSQSAHRRRRAQSPHNIPPIDRSLDDLCVSAASHSSPIIDRRGGLPKEAVICEKEPESAVAEGHVANCSDAVSSPLVRKRPAIANKVNEVPKFSLDGIGDVNSYKNDRSISDPIGAGGEQTGAMDSGREERDRLNSLSGEYVLRLKRGLAVRVWNPTADKWEAGSIQRQHHDGTFKVRFEDGHAEPHVASDRIAITRQMLHSLSSFSSSFESMSSAPSVASTPGEGEDCHGSLPRQSSGGDVDLSTHSAASQSQKSTRDWLERVKSGKSSDPKIEFVVEYPDDDWLGDSDLEDEGEPPRKSGGSASALSRDNSVSSIQLGKIVGYQRDSDAGTPVSSTTFQVDFPAPPMGFTLNKSGSGHAHVTKITPGGQASCSPIRLGDCVVNINQIPVGGYDDFIKTMLTVSYPAIVTFLRRKRSGETPDSTSSLRSATPTSPPIRRDDVMLPDAYKQLMEATKGLQLPATVGDISAPALSSRARSAPASHTGSRNMDSSPVAARLDMDDTTLASNRGELRDVCFAEQGEMGMGLMEKISIDGASVSSEVVDVFPGCMAARIGVEVGCVVIAVNSERYKSHAHTVATLKNSKRPITVRFLFPKRKLTR